MSTTPHKLIQFELASINANLWLGIRVSKYPSNKFPTIQDSVIIIEFLKVNSITFTFFSLFISVYDEIISVPTKDMFKGCTRIMKQFK